MLREGNNDSRVIKYPTNSDAISARKLRMLSSSLAQRHRQMVVELWINLLLGWGQVDITRWRH